MVALLILALSIYLHPAAPGPATTTQPDDQTGKQIANLWGQAEQSPDDVKLTDEMKRAANDLQIEEAVEATPSLTGGGLIEWNVYFDRKKLEYLLLETVPPIAIIGDREIIEWQDQTNSKLIAATVAAYEKCGKSADLTPEIDISCDFLEGVVGGNSFCGTRNYRGSKLLDSESFKDRVADSLPENLKDAGPIRLVVEVVPKQNTLRPRESLNGVLRIRNIGTSRVSINARAFPDVMVSSKCGQSVTAFPARFHACGYSWSTVPPISIAPGGALERDFSVATDPLGPFGGFELPEGEYVASFPDLKPAFNIPTYVKPATFKVKAASPSDLQPRIMRFGVGGRRLVCIRENGNVQVINIDDGSVVREFVATGYTPPESYEKHEMVSPDGEYLVLVTVGDVEHTRGTHLTIYSLNERQPANSAIRVPASGPSLEWPWQYPWLVGFDNSCKHLTVGSRERLCRVNVTNGNILNETAVKDAYPSWDGSCYLRSEGLPEPTIYHTENRRWNNPLRGPGKPNSYSWGRRGLYVGWTEAPGLVLVDDEGELIQRIPSKGQEIMAESPDGAFLAIRDSRDESGKIEIWDLNQNSRRFTLESGPDAVAFSSAPLLVISSDRKDGNAVLGLSTLNAKFEIRSISEPTMIRTLAVPPPRITK